MNLSNSLNTIIAGLGDAVPDEVRQSILSSQDTENVQSTASLYILLALANLVSTQQANGILLTNITGIIANESVKRREPAKIKELLRIYQEATSSTSTTTTLGMLEMVRALKEINSPGGTTSNLDEKTSIQSTLELLKEIRNLDPNLSLTQAIEVLKELQSI